MGILNVISFANVVMQWLCLASYQGELCVHIVMDLSLQCRAEHSVSSYEILQFTCAEVQFKLHFAAVSLDGVQHEYWVIIL